MGERDCLSSRDSKGTNGSTAIKMRNASIVNKMEEEGKKEKEEENK